MNNAKLRLLQRRIPISFFALFFLLASSSFAQTFYKTYPGSSGLRGVGIEKTPAGFELTAQLLTPDSGNWNILDTDNDGNLITNTSFSFSGTGEPNISTRLADGSILFKSMPNGGPDPQQASFRRVDTAGNILNEFSIPFPANTIPNVFPITTQLSDGTIYIVTGYGMDNPNGPLGVHLIYTQYDLTTDQFLIQNDILWGTSTNNLSIRKIIEAGDGKILLNIWDESFSNKHYIIKGELDGTEIWRRNVSSLERPVTDMVATPAGGVWYWNRTFNTVAHIDTDGLSIGSFDLSTFQNQIVGPAEVGGIVATPDNGCLVVGVASPVATGSYYFSALVSSNGTTLQTNALDIPGALPNLAIGTAISGGFALTGRVSAPTVPFLLSLDENGALNNPPQLVDLEIGTTGSTPIPDIYSPHTITLNVENKGNIPATGIELSIPLAAGDVYQGGNEYNASQGTFTFFGNQIWSVGTLAPDSSASITINYFKVSDVDFAQYAEVLTVNETDADSTPGNGDGVNANEDDESVYGVGAVDFGNVFLTLPGRGAVAQGRDLETEYSFSTGYSSTPFSLQVRNTFYLSTDKTLSADDIVLGDDLVDIDQNNFSSRSPSFFIPTSIAPGFYWVLVKLDANENFAESNENNNINTFGSIRRLLVTEQGNNLPDLVAGYTDVANTNPYQPGDNIPGGTYTLYNTGEATSGAIELAYYLSADENLSNNDVFISSRTFTPTNILHFSPQFISSDIFVPNNIASGDYFVLTVVDNTNAISESHEDNNVRASASKITVEGNLNPCSPDVLPPQITGCPGDQSLMTNGGPLAVNWLAPMAMDNCTASPSLTSNYNSGDAFPVGSTTVIYTATDAAGNSSTCSFTITVSLQPIGGCTNNILQEPGFENGFAGIWNNVDGGGEVTNDAYAGSKAMKIAVPGAARIIQTLSAEAGKTYTLSAFAKISDNSEVGTIYMKFMSASFQPIITAAEDIIGQTYQEWSLTFEAPANTAYVEIGLQKFGGNYALFADEWCFRKEGTPLVCSLSAEATNTQCFDNNTPNDVTDDTFTFSVTVDRSGPCGNSWAGGGTTGNYGQAQTFGPYPISNGNVQLTFADAGNPGSTATVLVTAPAPCSIGTGPQADLILSNFNAPGNGQVGTIINYTFDLSNTGNAPASGSFNIKAYFSTDNVLSADDVFDGLVPTGNLAAGQSVNGVPGASTIPGSLSSGVYFLILKVDADEQIAESNENNNIVLSLIDVLSGGGIPNCTATSDFPWEDWISRVKIGSALDQVSGKSVYSDFGNPAFNLVKDVSNTIDLTTSYSYYTFDEYWRVWIDLNQNDIYESNEVVYEDLLARPADGAGSKTLSGQFIIPANAVTGIAKMRVIMTRGAYAGPCGTIAFGEVEDYQVNILATAPNNRKQLALAEVRTYPNPVGDQLNIDLGRKAAQVEEIILLNQLGKVVGQWSVDKELLAGQNFEIDLSTVVNGAYFLQLRGDQIRPISKRILVQKTY